jgi:spore coat protein U-like protein
MPLCRRARKFRLADLTHQSNNLEKLEMNIRNSVRMALLATSVLGAGTALDAMAGSAAGTLSVTATVAANCAFTTNAVAFGTYDPVVTNLTAAKTATGSLSVTCTTGDSITVDMDQGINGTGTLLAPVRAMGSGVGGTGGSLLAYSLFFPSAAGAGGTATATLWGTGGATSFAYSATGIAQTINVFGSVAGGQNVPVGSYADTVNVTVNY